MKHLFLLVIPFLMFLSCGQSPAELAAYSADTIVKNQYPDLKNYKAVNTEMDSVYNTAFFNDEVMVNLYKLDFHKERYQLVADRFNDMQSFMFPKDSLWPDEKVQRKKDLFDIYGETLDEAYQKKKDYEKQLFGWQDEIAHKRDSIDGSQFYGWIVRHHFSYTDDLGMRKENMIIFIMKENGEIFNFIFLKEDDLTKFQNLFKEALKQADERAQANNA